MAARRLWVLIASAVLASIAALSLARAAGEGAAAGDFLVLAIKPEGEAKDYRMIPVGEASVDPRKYRDVVDSLPSSLFGGVMVRPHDERAELAQCRTACAMNANCENFTYVRPGKDRPVGVCHLRRATVAAAAPAAVAVATTPAPTVSMPPVVESPAPAPEMMVVSPQVRRTHRLVAIDSKRNGREIYKDADAPATPVTLRFNMPVSTATASVMTAGKRRVWANLEALDTKGRMFKRSGMWIAADGRAHQLLIRTDASRIGALRITSREEGALILQAVDFLRSAPEAAEPAVAEAEAAPAVDAQPVEVAEDEATPPAVAETDAEAAALPPRAAETAPGAPVDIVQAPQQIQITPIETTVAELPANGSHETAIAIPIAPVDRTSQIQPAAEPAQPTQPSVDVSLLGAAGAVVLGLGGIALYRQNYRQRQLARMTTRVISPGLDRHTVSISTGEVADLSLRYHIRMPAEVSARSTKIVIIPDGVAA